MLPHVREHDVGADVPRSSVAGSGELAARTAVVTSWVLRGAGNDNVTYASRMRKDRKMSRIASHPEDEVRHALEVLVTTTPTALDRALESVPARFASAAEAVRSALFYQQSIDALESALVTLPTAADPATARAAQATENVWRLVETEFGLLTSTEVSALLGASNANRAYAGQLRKRGDLLAAQRKNAYVFPGFQFDHQAGSVRPWVRPLLQLAERQDRSAAGVVMWMMSPTTYFDGERPVDYVADDAQLLDVAGRAWDIQW